MLLDFANNVTVENSINADEGAGSDTAKTGAIHDLANCGGGMWIINTGTLADADATFTVLVEDGNDSTLSDNAAVADEFLIGTEVGASFAFGDDNESRKIGYIGPKRYVRMKITPANNTGAWDIAASFLKFAQRKQPIAQ